MTVNNAELLLNEMKNEIIGFLGAGKIESAEIFMDQYIKLGPHTIDRYSLEALINTEKDDLKKANEVLLEGVKHHPLSFDLLYNLAYTFQHLEEPLEAYHIYMKAKYVAETEDEKKDIYKGLKSLVDDFKGTTEVKEDKVTTVVMIGKIHLNLSSTKKRLMERIKTLKSIEKHIDKNGETVLDIGFEDGIISKNLNFFGYDVVAVDPVKEKILNVIAREWHDNILQPEQKMAKFYEEKINLEWIKKIPEFDIIVAVADGNIERFKAEENRQEIFEGLLEKAKNQLIIRVSKENSNEEFNKIEIEELIKKYNLKFKIINQEEKEEGQFEIYSIIKEEIESFKLPNPIDIEESISTLVDIDLVKCRDLYGAGYIEDFHPFVELLIEYRKNPHLKYEDSILRKHY